jgi:tetratricopeptide (TPR) repeat protein
MQLTIEQALHEGIVAHKNGKIQEAEHFYQAILKLQPTHPDANHNLGLLAISVNKPAVAIPLFKAALKSNPKIEQFWLSYIDTLVKEKRFAEAEKVMEQKKQLKFIKQEERALVKQKQAQKDKHQNSTNKAPSERQLKCLLEYYRAAQYDDAKTLAISITQNFPHHSFSWQVLGALLNRTGQLVEAVMASKKAVSLVPDDPTSYTNLGGVMKQKGHLTEANEHYRQAIIIKPDFTDAYNNLGNTLKELDRLKEAAACHSKVIALQPDYVAAYINFGNTLKQAGRLEEAGDIYRKATTFRMDFVAAHYNLGNTLKELGRFQEAEESYRKAIGIKPDLVGAHVNLGITLKELSRLAEAEASYNQAIALKMDSIEAHYNLGNTLKQQNKLEEAEASYMKAIELKPDHAEAYHKLGNTLRELDRLENAEACCRQAIQVKTDFAQAHSCLGIILYAKGDTESALSSLKEAYYKDPNSKENELCLKIIQGRQAQKEKQIGVSNTNKLNCELENSSSPLILHRPVEPGLISSLYEMKTRELDATPDTRHGNGRCSDYDLFDHESLFLKTVSNDLTSIMKTAVQSEVYLTDTFFNIYSTGAGISPHTHLNKDDNDKHLNFKSQKYSLVYYISVGDQDGSEPGILKLYAPDEDILPREGMIVIIRADREHSAIYNGNKDRVIIGANFYSI